MNFNKLEIQTLSVLKWSPLRILEVLQISKRLSQQTWDSCQGELAAGSWQLQLDLSQKPFIRNILSLVLFLCFKLFEDGKFSWKFYHLFDIIQL